MTSITFSYLINHNTIKYIFAESSVAVVNVSRIITYAPDTTDYRCAIKTIQCAPDLTGKSVRRPLRKRVSSRRHVCRAVP